MTDDYSGVPGDNSCGGITEADRTFAISFFSRIPNLIAAFNAMPKHLQDIGVAIFIRTSRGYGNLSSANMTQFRLHRRKTWCAVEFQKRAIKLQINVDNDTNWLPKISLEPLTEPRPLGNEEERFVDYKLRSIADIEDAMVLIDAGFEYWDGLIG